MMERRRFLTLLGASAAAMALDPERLLWVPGAKTIFLPPVPSMGLPIAGLTVGDIFTVAGVYEPFWGGRKAGKQRLQKFVVERVAGSGLAVMVAPNLTPPLSASAIIQPVRVGPPGVKLLTVWHEQAEPQK